MPPHISKLPRRQDWPSRLHGSLLEHRHAAFAWGQHDCALSVCHHIEAVTGVDVGADFRGKYSSAETAAQFLAQYVGKPGATLEDLAVMVATKYNLKEINPKFAQRGDVVLFDTPAGQSLAVVHLNGTHAIGAGPDGLRRLRICRATDHPSHPGDPAFAIPPARRAWRIGVHLALEPIAPAIQPPPPSGDAVKARWLKAQERAQQIQALQQGTAEAPQPAATPAKSNG